MHTITNMEDTLLNWTTVPILEPLRPLSPEILDHNELTNLDINVGKLSRSEIAGKLLDHLDELHDEEAEPFDWFGAEKSIHLPIFENLPSPTSYKIENYVKQTPNYTFQTENHKTETFSSTQNYNVDAAQSPVAYQLLNSGLQQQTQPNELSIPYQTSDGKWLKDETLTPPESPKDEEILKLLQEIEPEDLEQLVMARTDFINSAAFSENSYSLDDEYSDVGSLSPFVGSDSGLDDPEWSPLNGVEVTNSGKITKKRNNPKPYCKPAMEEKKLRKKEQNKNAATRYRLKKKAEVEEIKSEENMLEDKNKALRSQFEDISREVKYLKSLMRDVYRKKGLIK